MPGVVQHTRDSLRKAAHEAVEAGVGGLILFGIPAAKDAVGSAGRRLPTGIVQRALADLAAELGDATVVMADLCLCEYTDHGHCGLLTDAGEVDNDATLERYAAVAVAQATAGAQVVAPRGMHGRPGRRRSAPPWTAPASPRRRVLAYAAKYASAFYGPFREAAESAPSFGDRRVLPAGPGQRRARRCARSCSTSPRAPTS